MAGGEGGLVGSRRWWEVAGVEPKANFEQETRATYTSPQLKEMELEEGACKLLLLTTATSART